MLSTECQLGASISGDVHLAVMVNSELGKDLAEKGLCAMVPIPESRLIILHGVVAENICRPSAHGRGLPAKSAGSKGTPSCRFGSVE